MTLVERLRAVESSSEWGNAPGAPTTCWYRNPDGPAAADALEAAEKALVHAHTVLRHGSSQSARILLGEIDDALSKLRGAE